MRRVIGGGAMLLAALGACTSGDSAGGSAPTAASADVVSFVRDSAAQYFLSAGPDGQVVYSRLVDGKANLFVADSNGGNVRQLTRGEWDVTPRWSPDGRWIAFARATVPVDLMVISADAGAERALTSTMAGEELVGWLPDNSGIVYRKVGAPTELWTATLDGKNERLIGAPGSTKGMISPDGRLVAYELLDKGRRALWLRDLATNDTRQLTTEGYESFPDGPGVWSSDSRRVLFVSTRSGTEDVWLVDVTSGKATQLTTDVRNDRAPQFSPDGRRVAFVSERGGQVDAWVVADTGGEPTRVSDDRAIESAVEWTRDGSSLLVNAGDGERHAYFISVDGGAPRRLFNERTEEAQLSVSADGRRIAFTSYDGPDQDVRTALLTGGASTLVAGGPADDSWPSISPDGTQVVFVSNRGGNQDLYLAPSEGGTAVALLSWPSRESYPTWSPDGQWIAFISSKESDQDIWIVKADGSGARRLTMTGIDLDAYAGVEWSHDSRQIVYSSPRADGEWDVRLIDVASGRTRVIVSGQVGLARIWPGDTLITLARWEGAMARLELRSIGDGTLVRSLSPAKGNSFEMIGEPSPDGRFVALAQFTFKNNDYRPAVRSMTDTTTRILMNLRGSTTEMWWLPDGKSLLFTALSQASVMYRKRVVKP